MFMLTLENPGKTFFLTFKVNLKVCIIFDFFIILAAKKKYKME